ncbi:hypothetical protein SAMN05444143_1105 [Flavobacterium succinicans]|uniref:DUF4397 domain-containing protein n=1 Tax=Flavobacterium succinicans TaxID=29536 RepID=A0A1I4XYI9_9FLAO|nr:DUF4397 domain-containing protein [Flavobacterium succinicans]SFN30443.1 hypothetical protein SAMN05444143_1105 [Flavobacterium succinicans]
MKNIFKKIKSTFLPLLGVLLVTSCGEENDFNPYESFDIENKAKVKFIHTAIGDAGVNAQLNFFLGTEKVSGFIISSGLPLGTGFGSTFPIENYSNISSGEQVLKGISPKIAATATLPEKPEVERFSEAFKTESGKYYSIFIIGSDPKVAPVTYTTHKINDDLSTVNLDKTKAYIRFINLIPNSPVAGYDLGLIKTTSIPGGTPVVTKEVTTYKGITFKGGKETFIAIEPQEAIDNRGYQIQLRVSGAAINTPGLAAPALVANQANSGTGIFIPRAGRMYTIFCRGYFGGVPTATANIPTISFYTNF